MKRLRAGVFAGNAGNKRVLEKNGFVWLRTVKDCLAVPAKGELHAELKSLDIFEWRP